MRKDKHRRKYRQCVSRIGADLIRKDTVDLDGCYLFQIYDMAPREWKERHEDSQSLFRPDPFGINDYFVDYSLNKKKRWTINEEIKDRIEEVQDQRLNIRVSSSVHGIDRSNLKSFTYWSPPRDKLPCLEYHTVSRDGKTITHKQSESGRSRLRNFTHPANPCRRTKAAKGNYRWSRNRERWTREYLEPEDGVEHQKLHVHYSTQKHSDKPSLHNKIAAKLSSRRKDSKERRSHHASMKYPNVFEIVEDVEGIMDDVIINDSFPIPTVVEDLSALVVRKEKKRRAGKREPHRLFVDELLKTSIFLPTPGTSGYGSEDDDEDEDEEIPSTSTSSSSVSSIPLVALPSEMFTRLSLSSLPHLPSYPRLPCYPPAWEIHQKDSLHLLGKNLLTSVIARQYGDEIRLAIVDEHSSSHLSRPQLPPSENEEIPPEIENVDVDYCEICCGDMNMTSDDRLAHPFSLSCAHLFCTGCWLSHISESVHRQRLPAACLNPECLCTVSIAAAKGILSSSSIEIYETSTIVALKAKEKLISCPDCKRVHYTNKSKHISCPCGASLCTHCSSVDHSPLGCDVFEQYNSYMEKSGFASIYSTSSDAPIIRDLARCPKCSALMQRSEGCNHMTCACGAEFCYCCGNKWNHTHYDCSEEQFKKMTMVDVSTARDSPLLVPSLLTLAVEARTLLIVRRKDLKKRLVHLPILEKKMVDRTFVQLSLIVELCYLSFRRSRKARRLADRIRFSLDDFFNTKDKHLSSKAHALKALRDSLIV